MVLFSRHSCMATLRSSWQRGGRSSTNSSASTSGCLRFFLRGRSDLPRHTALYPPRPWQEEQQERRQGAETAAYAGIAANGAIVAVGCDHMARERKAQLVEHLDSLGFVVDDCGTLSDERCDYPVYAAAVGDKVARGEAEWGLLICGTGVGMSVAANKVPGVRAALVADTFSAKMTRRHNDANVLCLGSWVIGEGLARELVTAWAESNYEGGRHQRRVNQMAEIERGARPVCQSVVAGAPTLGQMPDGQLPAAPRVVTLGEILVEIMRPSAGIPLKETGPFVGPFPSGAPAIFVDAVARLGHGSAIVGAVGADGFGDNVLHRLQCSGVTTDDLVLQHNHLPTATAHVSYDAAGERAFVFHIDGTAATSLAWPGTTTTLPAGLESASWFHAMGCSLMASDHMRAQILDAVECFGNNGGTISFDPNLRPELLNGRNVIDVVGPILERTSVLLPGISELHMLACVPDAQSSTSAADVGASVAKLFEEFEALQVVAVKRGADGASVYHRNESGVIDVPAVAVAKEVDPTGAGDYFDAAFVVGMLEGLPLEHCARVACAAGAANTVALGPMAGPLDRTIAGLPPMKSSS